MSPALKNLIEMAASISIEIRSASTVSSVIRYCTGIHLIQIKFKVVEDMTNEEHEEDEEVISCVVDEAVSQIGPTDEVMIKNRAYPIFCAVCLW